MKKTKALLAVLFILAITVTSCNTNDEFDEIKIEDVASESGDTGHTEGAGGQDPPPWPEG